MRRNARERPLAVDIGKGPWEGTAVDAALPQITDVLRGCKVFPCQVGAKVPATANGWKDASSDPAQLAQWHSANPAFNWAVACGPSNLFVLDVDPAGLAWWSDILKFRLDVAEVAARAFKVRTPRGGFHYYWQGEGPSTASRIAPGIDTRGMGGYVVLPGSHTPAGPYEALGGDLEPLPDCIRAMIPEKKASETKGLERTPGLDQPRNVQWAIDLLKSYVAEGRVSIKGQGGNTLAYQVAASILDKAISPALCLELLLEHWNPHCAPEWEEWELETVVRNAANYGEETKGAKGFQSNQDAFAAFAGYQEPGPDIGIPISEKRKVRFRPQTLTEARKNIKPPSWLIPGLIPSIGAGILFGASGSYKSFLVLDMALCLAHGVAGQWGAPPVPHKVLFLAGEQGHALIGQRVDSWCEWQGVPAECENFIVVQGVPAIRDSDGWRDVREGLLEMDIRPDLIIIDTVARAITGMKEDSNDDSIVVIRYMEELAAHYGAFVLGIHHTGKDESKGARGAGGWESNPDVVHYVKKRGKGATSLSPKKLKETDVPDEPLLFKTKEFGQSIVLERCDSIAEAPRAGKSRTDWNSADEVMAALRTNGGAMGGDYLAQHIAGKYGLDRGAVKRALSGREDLNWLKDGTGWRVPAQTQEFDL